MSDIVFESVAGIVIITFWFTILWYAAKFLSGILPPFEWSILVAPAYGLKYLIYLGDVALLAVAYVVDIKVAIKRILQYGKENA